jgi:hypothetical protein
MIMAPTEKDLKATREPIRDADQKTGGKRYNLVLPRHLYEEVQTVAKEQNTSIPDLLKRFIKIGLLVAKLSQSPDTTLIIREGNREREVVFV